MSTPAEKPVRKNHYLYQSKIDMVREILDAGTETEALDRALDLVIYGEALARGTEAMLGEEYHDVLGIEDELPGGNREPGGPEVGGASEAGGAPEAVRLPKPAARGRRR